MVAIDGSYCCPVVADEGLAAGHPYLISLPPSSCPLGHIINFFVFVFSYEVAQWIKNSICTAGDTGDMGSIPGSGRSPGTHSAILLENPLHRGAWRAAVHGITESRTQRMQLSTHIFRMLIISAV